MTGNEERFSLKWLKTVCTYAKCQFDNSVVFMSLFWFQIAIVVFCVLQFFSTYCVA